MLEFPPFKLDAANQCLWESKPGAADLRRDLSPKAFSLLEYLAKQRGRLVTQDELLDIIWPNQLVQPEVIKGHIQAVRKALGDHARVPRYIETHFKRGYRFVADVRELTDAKAPRAPITLDRTPMVGREAVSQALWDALTSSRAGQSKMLWIAGDPGIGKTRLVEDFADRASKEDGVLVGIGRCTEGLGGIEPYFPFLDALTQMLGGEQGSCLAETIDRMAPSWASQLSPHMSAAVTKRSPAPQQMKLGMPREFCDLIGASTAKHHIVLIFEDLHWSDHASLELLDLLAQRPQIGRVLIVCTYRTRKLLPASFPLAELTIKGYCEEIKLGPLSKDAIQKMVAGDSGATDLIGLSQLIADHSSGNPLVAVATLDNLRLRGILNLQDGSYGLLVPLNSVELRLPEKISQIIEACLAELDATEIKVLEAASIEGVTFDSMVAAPACGMAAVDFEDVCERLCRNHNLIRRDAPRKYPDGALSRQFSFCHVIYQQSIYQRQGPLRLQQAHRSIAEALEALYPATERGSIALQLAQHRAGAREWAQALEYVRMALLIARARLAYRDGLRMFDLGIEFARNLGGPEGEEAELSAIEGRAGVYVAIRDSRAAPAYRQIQELAEARGLIDVKARALIGRMYCLSPHNYAESVGLLQEIEGVSRLQTDPLQRARTEVACFVSAIRITGWTEEYDARLQSALQTINKSPDPILNAWAKLESSQVDVVSSRYRQGVDCIRQQIPVLLSNPELKIASNSARLFATCRVAYAWGLFFLGEFGECQRAIDDGISLLDQQGNVYTSRILRFAGAWLATYLGNHEEALKHLAHAEQDRGHSITEAQQLMPYEHRIYLVLKGLAELGRGNTTVARQDFLDFEARMKQTPCFMDWYWNLLLHVGLTDLHLAENQLDQALQRATQLLALAFDRSEKSFQGLALDALARVHLARNSLGDAASTIERGIALVAASEVPLARWAVHGTAAKIYSALDESAKVRMSKRAFAEGRQRLASSLPPGYSAPALIGRD